MLFECLKKLEWSINPDDLSSLLFAEMYPIEFMQNAIKLLKNIEERLSDNQSSFFTYPEVKEIEHDQPALMSLKENSLKVIKKCLEKIISTINNPAIKESILMSVIDSGDIQLLQFLLDNGYSTHSLREDTECDLKYLINNNHW